MNRKEAGILGEKLARDFLKKRGCVICETNYRCSAGEIDIIVRDKGCLAFVEVRTKTGTGFGTPEESITAAKVRHLIAAAAHYCQTHDGLPESRRIDLVAVELDRKGIPLRIELIQNAVSDAG